MSAPVNLFEALFGPAMPLIIEQLQQRESIALNRRMQEETLKGMYDVIVDAGNDTCGYIVAEPATIVWALRGNFVEISVAHLGKNDTYNREKGIRTAVQHLAEGMFILVPINPKLRGFDAETVVAKVFNFDILNGNGAFRAKLQDKMGAELAVEMQRRGVITGR